MTRQFKRLDNARSVATGLFGVLTLALSLTLALTPRASAQEPVCYAHDSLAELLDERFTESRVAAGLEVSGRLVQLYTSADSASWTMVITTPAGESCVIAVGEHWQELKLPAAGEPAV